MNQNEMNQTATDSHRPSALPSAPTSAPTSILVSGDGLCGLLMVWVLLRHPGRVHWFAPGLQKANGKWAFTTGAAIKQTIVLARASIDALRALGLSIDGLQRYSIDHIRISDAGHVSKVVMETTAARPSFGEVVYIDALREYLLDRIQQHPDAAQHLAIHTQAAQQCQVSRAEASVTCADGTRVSGAWLALCEGSESDNAKQLGFDYHTEDFSQTAILTEVEVVDVARVNAAHERFTAQGPIALLPLPDKRLSLVWSMSPEQAERLTGIDDHAFLSTLQDAFGDHLGRFISVSRRATVPLCQVKVERPHRHRSSVFGNAAQLLHPIAGQGFNLWLRDLLAVDQCLSHSHEIGKSHEIGSYRWLASLQQSRTDDRNQLLWATELLVRTFSTDNALLTFGRQRVLMTLQLCPWLKSQVENYAQGVRQG